MPGWTEGAPAEDGARETHASTWSIQASREVNAASAAICFASRIGLPNAGRRVPAADDELYVGCPAAESAANVAGIDLRLWVEVRQADDIHAVEVELPQRSLADSDRRQDTRTDAAFAEHLRHHLDRCTIEFRTPGQAED